MNISTILGDITCQNKAEIEEIMKKGAAQQRGDERCIAVLRR